MADLPIKPILKRLVPAVSAAEAGVAAYNALQDSIHGFLIPERPTARPGDVDIQGLQNRMKTEKGDIATTVSMKKLEIYKEGWLKRQEGLEVSQDRLGERAVKKLRSDRQKMIKRRDDIGDLIVGVYPIPKDRDKLRKEYSDLEQMIARNLSIETHSTSGTEKTQGKDLVEFLRKNQQFEKGLRERERWQR
jgi:hypothetical protein